ncbi:hypothetical protein HDU93_008607 [Gonapodya sp. JEL0774]|nr:hypothetical protein HDU93_008607 [Gonapodya sp. JEL0774]
MHGEEDQRPPAKRQRRSRSKADEEVPPPPRIPDEEADSDDEREENFRFDDSTLSSHRSCNLLDEISTRVLQLSYLVKPVDGKSFIEATDVRTSGGKKKRHLKKRLEEALDRLEEFVHAKLDVERPYSVPVVPPVAARRVSFNDGGILGPSSAKEQPERRMAISRIVETGGATRGGNRKKPSSAVRSTQVFVGDFLESYPNASNFMTDLFETFNFNNTELDGDGDLLGTATGTSGNGDPNSIPTHLGLPPSFFDFDQSTLASTLSAEDVLNSLSEQILGIQKDVVENQQIWSPANLDRASISSGELLVARPPVFSFADRELSGSSDSPVVKADPIPMPKSVSVFDDLPPLPDDDIMHCLLQQFYVRSWNIRHFFNPFLVFSMLAVGSLEPLATVCAFTEQQLLAAGTNVFQRCKRLLLPSIEATMLHHSTIEGLTLFAQYANIKDRAFMYMTVGMAVAKVRESGLLTDPNLVTTKKMDWREAEERRRVGWAAVSIDRLAGLLVSRTPFLDESEIKLEMPCSSAKWESNPNIPINLNAQVIPEEVPEEVPEVTTLELLRVLGTALCMKRKIPHEEYTISPQFQELELRLCDWLNVFLNANGGWSNATDPALARALMFYNLTGTVLHTPVNFAFAPRPWVKSSNFTSAVMHATSITFMCQRPEMESLFYGPLPVLFLFQSALVHVARIRAGVDIAEAARDTEIHATLIAKSSKLFFLADLFARDLRRLKDIAEADHRNKRLLVA